MHQQMFMAYRSCLASAFPFSMLLLLLAGLSCFWHAAINRSPPNCLVYAVLLIMTCF